MRTVYTGDEALDRRMELIAQMDHESTFIATMAEGKPLPYAVQDVLDATEDTFVLGWCDGVPFLVMSLDGAKMDPKRLFLCGGHDVLTVFTPAGNIFENVPEKWNTEVSSLKQKRKHPALVVGMPHSKTHVSLMVRPLDGGKMFVVPGDEYLTGMQYRGYDICVLPEILATELGLTYYIPPVVDNLDYV